MWVDNTNLRMPYLILGILLGHGLFFRLAFTLVPVVLEPNFHLKNSNTHLSKPFTNTVRDLQDLHYTKILRCSRYD